MGVSKASQSLLKKHSLVLLNEGIPKKPEQPRKLDAFAF
jgi:hypothetical protein